MPRQAFYQDRNRKYILREKGTGFYVSLDDMGVLLIMSWGTSMCSSFEAPVSQLIWFESGCVFSIWYCIDMGGAILTLSPCPKVGNCKSDDILLCNIFHMSHEKSLGTLFFFFRTGKDLELCFHSSETALWIKSL